MASIPAGTQGLDPYRPQNQSGQPSWTLVYATLLDTDQPSQGVTITVRGGWILAILGWELGSVPTAQAIAGGMIGGGQATRVYYIECWAQDGRILGTGTITYLWIGVWR